MYRRDQNRGVVVNSGIVWREPIYWPSGLRHKGGMNVIQALVWNVGTCALMSRERSKWKPREELSTKAEYRGGLIRSSDEAGES